MSILSSHRSTPARAARVTAAVLGVLLASSVAAAAVRREGTWPESDRKVSLKAERVSRAEAIRRLADAAGWSVVVAGAASDEPVEVHVRDEPADAVLDLLLAEGSWVATRNGSRISIAPAPSAAAPVPSTDVAPPTPPAVPEVPAVPDAGVRGSDRVISGGSLRVDKNETVHDVAVFGGSVDVYGTVTGELTVMGGSATLHEGAHVHGDATAVGGSVDIRDGARVDGDVATMGGRIKKGDRAQIGGDMVQDGRPKGGEASEAPARSEPLMSRAVREVSSAVTQAALLFVLGAVLIALAGSRMERLQAEVAARPMRSFALGVVTVLTALVLFVALCVIVVGIPFALVGLLLFIVGVGAGVCAVLGTVGAALVRHRTQSPYIHLAVGCGVLLVVGSIPYLGDLAWAAVVLAGLGSLAATRAAGLADSKPTSAFSPYRGVEKPS